MPPKVYFLCDDKKCSFSQIFAISLKIKLKGYFSYLKQFNQTFNATAEMRVKHAETVIKITGCSNKHGN